MHPLRLADLQAMTPKDREAAIAQLAAEAIAPTNGQAVGTAARIKEFERTYEMTSEALVARLSAGEIQETAAIAEWLFWLKVRGGIVTNRHGPNRLGNYISIHNTVMMQFVAQGFATTDSTEFSPYGDGRFCSPATSSASGDYHQHLEGTGDCRAHIRKSACSDADIFLQCVAERTRQYLQV